MTSSRIIIVYALSFVFALSAFVCDADAGRCSRRRRSRTTTKTTQEPPPPKASSFYKYVIPKNPETERYEGMEQYNMRNYAEAAKLFQRAAERGDGEAQGFLAMMYENGEGGLPQSYEDAYFWAKLAEESSPGKWSDLVKIYKNKLNNNQIKKINKEISEWFPRREAAIIKDRITYQ